MKRLLLLLCFGILCSIAGYSPTTNTILIEITQPIKPYEALWLAMGQVESSGNPNALNRLEMAFGIVQIRAIRLKDYNEKTGKSYSLRQMYDPVISKEIWIYYAIQFHYSQSELIARAWNGSGEKTKDYWRLVKKQMKK